MKKYLTYLLLAVAVLVMLTGWFLVPTAARTPVLGGGLVVAVAALISAIVIPSPDKAKKQEHNVATLLASAKRWTEGEKSNIICTV